jgi:hypothetical protein
LLPEDEPLAQLLLCGCQAFIHSALTLKIVERFP